MDKLIQQIAIAKYGSDKKGLESYKQGCKDVLNLVGEALADAVYINVLTSEDMMKVVNLIQDYAERKKRKYDND